MSTLYRLFNAPTIIRLADLLIYFVSQSVTQVNACLLWIAYVHYYILPTVKPYLNVS